ncbi:hypothetical protein LCGC14_0676710 [marine sediment metagenome]|uniref:Ribbon-helix-helix protein CopG domain-containing protein n=1 Tax=marine sediment metagenome TaxID=412755 RepID=A0A0F9R9J5_9ZZZZ
MSRTALYPEGASMMNNYGPKPVIEAITRVARQQRQSRSQLVFVIIEDWLRRRGELPPPERQEV